MNIRNSITLIGHLGQDPISSKTDAGTSMTRFSLATNEYYRDKKGELVTRTEWHNCIVWGQLAERLATQLKKGQEVIITGSINYRDWQDDQGVKRRSCNVKVQHCLSVGKRTAQAVEA